MKQEREFHKMMEKLKKQQSGADDSESSGESGASNGSKTSESEADTVSAQEDEAEGAGTGTAKDPSKDLAAKKEVMPWLRTHDRARSLNVSEPPLPIANPFENTPHGEAVASYLNASKQLQTLHLGHNEKNKALAGIKSMAVAAKRRALDPHSFDAEASHQYIHRQAASTLLEDSRNQGATQQSMVSAYSRHA